MFHSPSELAVQLLEELTTPLHVEICRWIIMRGGAKDPELFRQMLREFHSLQARLQTADLVDQ